MFNKEEIKRIFNGEINPKTPFGKFIMTLIVILFFFLGMVFQDKMSEGKNNQEKNVNEIKNQQEILSNENDLLRESDINDDYNSTSTVEISGVTQSDNSNTNDNLISNCNCDVDCKTYAIQEEKDSRVCKSYTYTDQDYLDLYNDAMNDVSNLGNKGTELTDICNKNIEAYKGLVNEYQKTIEVYKTTIADYSQKINKCSSDLIYMTNLVDKWTKTAQMQSDVIDKCLITSEKLKECTAQLNSLIY